jgi:subtilisin family serine protease
MIPSDPLYAQQWHFVGSLGGIDDPLGNIEKIWDEYSGAGIAVGVYDYGVELGHPDLAANHDPALRIVIDGAPIAGTPDDTPPNPHGTGVTGLIAGRANNGLGVVGVAWGSSFASVDILDPTSTVSLANGDSDDVVSALTQTRNFDITNQSWNALLADYRTEYNLAGGSGYKIINDEYRIHRSSVELAWARLSSRELATRTSTLSIAV